jgi:hypothetical protein
VHEGLDRRAVLVAGLLADAVLRQLGRGERIARQRLQDRVVAHDGAGLRPGAVDDDERHRAGRRLAEDIARAGAGVEQDRRVRRIGEGGRERRVLAPADADVERRRRQAEAGHARGADRHVALARVLEDHDARAGRQVRQRGAVADALGPAAARAHGARHERAPCFHGRCCTAFRRDGEPRRHLVPVPGCARGRVGSALV